MTGFVEKFPLYRCSQCVCRKNKVKQLCKETSSVYIFRIFISQCYWMRRRLGSWTFT